MRLIRSVVTLLLVYCFLQSAVFFAVFRRRSLPFGFFVAFLAVQAAFYCGIAFFLIKNRRLFYRIHGGQAENSVNGANKITLFRISMLPFLVFLSAAAYLCGEIGLAPASAFALTFASDFFDGRIARKFALETYMGKILDSASDYLLLGLSACALYFFGILMAPLFLIILVRLFFNSLAMLILFLVHKKLRPETTPAGKIAIAAIMVLLVVEAARPALTGVFAQASSWIGGIELAAGLVTGLSVLDKAWYLARQLKTPGRACGLTGSSTA